MYKELNENSLLSFINFNDFLDFYKDLEIYNKWRISAGTMNSRGKCIVDKRYSSDLQILFKEKNMFRKKVSIAEIVSWLDSFKLIERLFIQLRQDLSKEVFEEINIFSEYVIRMSKKMRIDYILLYKNRLLLIEMRMVSSFEKIRSAWEKKKIELVIYKDLMNNYLPCDIKVISYAFISLPEYQIHTKIDKHVEYNKNQINYLKMYILEFLI